MTWADLREFDNKTIGISREGWEPVIDVLTVTEYDGVVTFQHEGLYGGRAKVMTQNMDCAIAGYEVDTREEKEGA